ncbi:hypothetical protein FRC15_011158, partial [Serendipita sp. 397]
PFTDTQITKLWANAPPCSEASDTSSLHSQEIQIFVKTFEDSTITLNVTLDEPVVSVKKKIEEETGTPVSLQRLIYAGRNVGDDGTLADYRVKRLSTLHLVGRFRGG